MIVIVITLGAELQLLLLGDRLRRDNLGETLQPGSLQPYQIS